MKHLLTLMTAALIGISSAQADTTVYAHTGAWHADNADGRMSNDVFGAGIKRGNTEVGVYRHSLAEHADNGALGGAALYVMQQKTWQIGALDVGVFGGLTYGYPDWLEYSRGGVMPIAGAVAELGRARVVIVPESEKSATTLMFSIRLFDL